MNQLQVTSVPDPSASTASGLPPNSVVWTSLPLLSWIFPWVGHVGLTE